MVSWQGDASTTWDSHKVAAGEDEWIFEAAPARGATAFKSEADRSFQQMKRFDQAAEHIILVPCVMGG